MMQFQSPKLDAVIKNLTDFVVDTFEVTGMQQGDFDSAMQRAMDEYRSSRYRFPDDVIEQRVRQSAMQRVQAASSIPTSEPAMSMPAPMTEDDTEPTPMMRDKAGNMVPDPFAAQAAARNKGKVMKESLVKRLRTLLETEVSQAEVMMAAKGFAQELQEMIEKIGRLSNEDLPPVSDQMRETYGSDSSMAFQTQISGALQSVMDSLYAAKSQVDDAVSNMATTGQVTAAVDMDKELGMGADVEEPLPMDADLDNIAADLEADADSFGAEDGEEPLGRAMKAESVDSMQRKILEMQRLVDRARKLRESNK